MAVDITKNQVRSILTRTSGFLRTVTSHSLQPYRGCTYGSSLCGVGCYVRHNGLLTRGREWGTFLEVRTNAAEAYLQHVHSERRWARREGDFSIFLSSSTEPFVPQERKFQVTRSVLEAMSEEAPDELVLQTHSAMVIEYVDLLAQLSQRTRLRVHLSIESDTDRLPGLPAPASSVDRRFEAAATLRAAGIHVVITVAPLLPIADPEAFFARIAKHADAVVIDHFIGGDGSVEGARTTRTGLPEAMAAVDPDSTGIAYRDRMIEIAQLHLPGMVGVNIDGFAGRFLSP
jgi:DNA repair photolyase